MCICITFELHLHRIRIAFASRTHRVRIRLHRVSTNITNPPTRHKNPPGRNTTRATHFWKVRLQGVRGLLQGSEVSFNFFIVSNRVERQLPGTFYGMKKYAS